MTKKNALLNALVVSAAAILFISLLALKMLLIQDLSWAIVLMPIWIPLYCLTAFVLMMWILDMVSPVPGGRDMERPEQVREVEIVPDEEI